MKLIVNFNDWKISVCEDEKSRESGIVGTIVSVSEEKKDGISYGVLATLNDGRILVPMFYLSTISGFWNYKDSKSPSDDYMLVADVPGWVIPSPSGAELDIRNLQDYRNTLSMTFRNKENKK